MSTIDSKRKAPEFECEINDAMFELAFKLLKGGEEVQPITVQGRTPFTFPWHSVLQDLDNIVLPRLLSWFAVLRRIMILEAGIEKEDLILTIRDEWLGLLPPLDLSLLLQRMPGAWRSERWTWPEADRRESEIRIFVGPLKDGNQEFWPLCSDSAQA